MNKSVIATTALLALAMACGGLTSPDSDSGSGDGDTSGDGGAGDGAGWTNCSSPNGYMVCGGPNDCNAGTDCAQYCQQTGNELQACNGGIDNIGFVDNPPCPDGTLLLPGDKQQFTDSPLLGECVVDEIGQLFHRNGADARLMYADFSAYDGTPLPQPATCPAVTGLTLCGGTCTGSCASGSYCYGRSPKHPYSLCTINGGVCSTADQTDCKTFGQSNKMSVGCLIFSDDSASQTTADAHGICVDAPTCAAAASSYPGGAKCIAL
jgi:hypothetical protein